MSHGDLVDSTLVYRPGGRGLGFPRKPEFNNNYLGFQIRQTWNGLTNDVACSVEVVETPSFIIR